MRKYWNHPKINGSTSPQGRSIFQPGMQPWTFCLPEKTQTYPLGRGLDDYDTCAVDAIVKHLESDHTA